MGGDEVVGWSPLGRTRRAPGPLPPREGKGKTVSLNPEARSHQTRTVRVPWPQNHRVRLVTGRQERPRRAAALPKPFDCPSSLLQAREEQGTSEQHKAKARNVLEASCPLQHRPYLLCFVVPWKAGSPCSKDLVRLQRSPAEEPFPPQEHAPTDVAGRSSRAPGCSVKPPSRCRREAISR